MNKKISSRREFVKSSVATGLAFSILPSGMIFSKEKDNKVRVGIIGVGSRGRNHLRLALERKDVEVIGICDVQQSSIDLGKEVFKKAKKSVPKIYLDGPYGYKKLLEDPNLDAVIIATPWEWHFEQCRDAMLAGKYAGCEVNVALTVEECWELVHTFEKTGTPLMMLENVCYRRDVMAVMNMVRQNVFGEIIHLQGGYQHDIRDGKINYANKAYLTGTQEKDPFVTKWRTVHSLHRNGDVYPTHGIGPLAMMADINRGNRFTQLVSYSTKSRGLKEFAKKLYGENDPKAKVDFKLGDIVTTMISCANGETVLLQHDTNLPRPYSLGFRVQGVNGLWMDVNESIYIEGKSQKEHQWEEAKAWLEKYDHPLWKKYSAQAEGAGHGGMDFFVLNAFIEAVKRKVNTPQDVYDAVSWTAISPLSETSIRLGGESVDFPDFTGGQWMYRKNEFALDDQY